MLPKQFPRVRVPFLAALLSPIAWQVGRPDLFDSYSAGVLLLQMAGKSRLTRLMTNVHVTWRNVTGAIGNPAADLVVDYKKIRHVDMSFECVE